MGGRDIDNLKKPGQKIKAVSGSSEKPLILGNLICYTLVPGDAVEETKTNLL